MTNTDALETAAATITLARRFGTAAQILAADTNWVAVVDAQGRCPGCGTMFKGERGLKAHQHGRRVSMDCKPR